MQDGRESNIYDWPWIETVSARRIKKEPYNTKGNLLEWSIHLRPDSGANPPIHPSDSFLSPLRSLTPTRPFPNWPD